MNRCPCCGRPHDALAGGVARVVGARVVTYCGVACRERARHGGVPLRLTRGALTLVSASVAWPAARVARTLGRLRFSMDLAVLAVSVALLALGAGALFVWARDPGRLPVFERFAAVSPPARWQAAGQGREPGAGNGTDTVRRTSDAADLDPIEAGGRALDVLEESVETERPSLWDLDALEVLAARGHERATGRLVSLARAELGPARRRAAVALARVGRPEGLDVLREDLASRVQSVSSLAALELGRLGDQTALPVLRRMMTFTETRMSAAEAAVFLRHEPARVLLRQTVKGSTRPGDRVRAAVALAAAGDAFGRELLERLYEDGQFRFLAAVGLGHLGDRRVEPVLRAALGNTALRLEVAQQLVRFNLRDAYRDVLRDLESEHAPTRTSAAVAVYLLTAPAAPAGPGQDARGPGEGAAHG